VNQPETRKAPGRSRCGPRFSVHDAQALRRVVQAAFLLLCLWIGVEFFLFMRWAASLGQTAYVPHPPGAEGFLPISALLSLKLWILTGTVHAAHPAGLFILVAILAIGLLLKKAFCSWLCPVGTLGEALARLGRRLWGRSFQPPAWADWPLRGLKYLILGFFLWTIGGMSGPALAGFLASPYNALADVKLYLFFLRLSGVSLAVVAALAVLSTLVEGFWCRYLCPYGALLGLASFLSPLRITRSGATCIDCRKCTKACPARIQVHSAGKVRSDECTGCYRCVSVCPVKDTLEMRAPGGKAVPPLVFALLVAGLFVAVTGAAMLAGHWRNGITREQYLYLIQQVDRF
jgi:polyferredoxin